MSLFHSQRTHSPQRVRRSLVYQSRYTCATKGPLFFCVVCDIFLATMYNEWEDYKKKIIIDEEKPQSLDGIGISCDICLEGMRDDATITGVC